MSSRWGSPSWRNISLPTVMITVPTTAPVTVRMPPTTSIASTSTAASSVYWRGFVLPIVWTRSAPAKPITAMLTVQAGQPGAEHADAERRRGDLVLPGRDREATGACLAEPVGDEHRKRRGEPQPDGALQDRHAGEPAGTLRELLPVLHHLVDHEQHGQRDHRRRQTAGPGDGDADDRAECERHEHRDERRRQGAEVDVAQPERQVGELLRLGRDRDRADRHGVRRDLGEREVSEREDAGVAHEHLEAEHQHQVDEQLVDEQLSGRAAGRGVDDGRDEQGDRQDRRRGRRAPDPQPPRVAHTRSAVVHLEQPRRSDDEQQRDQPEHERVGEALGRAVGQVRPQEHLGEAERQPADDRARRSCRGHR